MPNILDSNCLIGRLKSEALVAVDNFVPTDASMFFSVDAKGSTHSYSLKNTSLNILNIYLDQYQNMDPIHPRNFMGDNRSIITLEDIEPIKRDHSSFLGEFLPSMNLVHEVNVFLRDGPTLIGGLALLRTPDKGRFTGPEIGCLRWLIPVFECGLQAAAGPLGDGAKRRYDIFGFTTREAEVVDLVRSGHANAAIGRELGISLATVKTHLVNIFSKAGVRSRTQLLSQILGIFDRFDIKALS